MRSNEERIAEVKRRIEKREREERLHRSRITGICAVAASLVLIICLSFFIPDAASRSRNNSYSNYVLDSYNYSFSFNYSCRKNY